MPAITLGLAEVEERLRALRRRLNSGTAQHSAYLAATAVLLVIAAVVMAALRASAPIFQMTAWGGALLAIVAVSACASYARRHWLDIPRTAHLADGRGQLTDRLATLVDLRLRPRPSRLAPVLVAQVLALGPRWQAARIAPRCIPRSIFPAIIAFLLLTGTLFIEPHTPPGPPPTTATGQRSAPADASAPALIAPNGRSGAGQHGGMQDGSQPTAALQASGDFPPREGDAGAGQESSGDVGRSSEEARTGRSLTDRLQQKIQHAFRGDTRDQAAQMASRAGDTSGQEGSKGSEPDEHSGRKDRSGNQTNPSAEPANNAAQQRRASGSKSQSPDPQGHTGTDAPQNLSGSAPAAGEGSNPQGLMDPNAAGVVAENEAKRFKLTITSFLHPVQPQLGNRAPRPGSGAGALGASASGADLALSERQMTDDALRKAEIPPEYEDLVKRVYSTRAEP